jgi:hypothetical protein
MRRLILIAVAAIGLTACGKNGQEDTNQVAVESLTAESIVSNDVTAIDAVTGDAANMAADVDVNYGNLAEDQGTTTLNAPGRSRPTATGPSTAAEPATENTTATPANTTSNSQ